MGRGGGQGDGKQGREKVEATAWCDWRAEAGRELWEGREGVWVTDQQGEAEGEGKTRENIYATDWCDGRGA